MTLAPLTGRRSVEVPCTVEIEESAASLRAHVDLQGFAVGPGDSVLVHDAPVHAGPRQRLCCRRRATVTRAGWLARTWTRLSGVFEIGELYEVGFTSRRRR